MKTMDELIMEIAKANALLLPAAEGLVMLMRESSPDAATRAAALEAAKDLVAAGGALLLVAGAIRERERIIANAGAGLN
jgi:selenophosphate synthetase-related protein